MAVEVNVGEELATGVLMEDCSLDGVYGRVEYWIGVGVLSVEIKSLSVVPPVTSCDAIWIEEWHKFEYELLQEEI